MMVIGVRNSVYTLVLWLAGPSSPDYLVQAFQVQRPRRVEGTTHPQCCIKSLLRSNRLHTEFDQIPATGQASCAEPRQQPTNAATWIATTVFSLSFALATWTNVLPSSPAYAADYGSLTDEQKVVAEAWRTLDNSFLDRTFAGQDWFAVRKTYVERRYKNMAEAQTAIAEMASSLGDPYTRYLSPSKYQSLVDSATGTLAGVGVEISVKDKHVIASDVESNSPASKGGIQPNDVFVQVDGNDIGADATPDDVALLLRGPPGSKVGVVMQRPGGGGSNNKLDLILTRAPITITTVKSYVTNVNGVGGKVGVVRIKNFSGTTSQKVQNEVNDLIKKGLKAIVLDLRGNPGGLLPGGVDTAGLFLDANAPVVFVVNKSGTVDAQSTFGAGPYANTVANTPLVVLVDQATASAAEVLTAALQENGRAKIAGETTFGKGIVQTIRELRDKNGGLAITVARYETPQHHDINKRGIPVDVETPVDCPKDNAGPCLTAAAFKTQ